ncbi:MAG: hypothetical protein AAB925_01100 [Patescibacteria group bacterium]|mgnify:CR=1 FL=1
MQKQKGISTLVGITIIVAVAIIAFGGVFAYQYFTNPKTQTSNAQLNLNSQNSNTETAGLPSRSEQQNQQTINQPSVTVISPSGGETWKIGEQQTIRYGTSNVGRAAICVDAYAVNSLGNKIPLDMGNYISITENSGLIFNLGIGDSANITQGAYRVELVVHACAETNDTFVASATSKGYITILANPNFIKPSITQISPEWGNKNDVITISGNNLSEVGGILLTPIGKIKIRSLLNLLIPTVIYPKEIIKSPLFPQPEIVIH